MTAIRRVIHDVAPGVTITRTDEMSALVAAAKPAVRLMYGAALMFMFAAFVEAFWSPMTDVPFDVKIGVGLGGWALALAYFLLAGRGRAAR